MPLRRRGGGRRERGERFYIDTHSGISVFCRGHFGGVRLSGKAPAKGSAEIYFVVVFSFSCSRNRNWLGHVSVFPLETPIQCGCEGLGTQEGPGARKAHIRCQQTLMKYSLSSSRPRTQENSLCHRPLGAYIFVHVL